MEGCVEDDLYRTGNREKPRSCVCAEGIAANDLKPEKPH
jgi:hypothetical protein